MNNNSQKRQSSYKLSQINKIILFLLLTSFMFSCFEKKDYNTSENYWLVNKKMTQFAEHLEKKHDRTDHGWESYYKILNKETKVVDGKKKYIYKIAIPHSLRESHLKTILVRFASKYRRDVSVIEIKVLHTGIEDFSGIFATYKYSALNSTVKSKIEYKNFLNEDLLIKKGIKHHILKYDYMILLSWQDERRKNPNRSNAYVTESTAKKYAISKAQIKRVLKFARKYYKK